MIKTFSESFMCMIYGSTDFDYVKFIRYNLKDLQRRHVCNCGHVNYISCKVCTYVCDLLLYRIPQALIQLSARYRRRQTEI